MNLAVDIDGTLLQQLPNGHIRLNHELIDLLRAFRKVSPGIVIYLWSGSGVDYAETIANRYSIRSLFDGVIVKGSEPVDIAFDDEKVILGLLNIIVPTP